MKICRRKTDNAMFLPSYPESWDDADALRSLLPGAGCDFYFRRVRLHPRKWYFPFRRWVRTGEIWQPKDPCEFDVLDSRIAMNLFN